MADLKGKTLFITGASRGIGLAIAKRAAADGANIVIAAKSNVANPKLPGTIHTAAAEIEAAGGKALALAVDIREEDQVREAVKLSRRLIKGSPDEILARIDEEAQLFAQRLRSAEAQKAFMAFLNKAG